MDAVLDLLGIAAAVDDNGGVLVDLDLAGTAEIGELSLLQVHVQLVCEVGAAGQDGDIAEHFLAAIAEAGRLDADAVEAAAQTVDEQGGQRIALDVLGDDDELLAGLDDLLQNGQDVLNGGDLLIGDEQVRIIDNSFHLVGVGDHIRGDIAAVELHAFDNIEAGLGGLGLFDGDDASGRDLLHGLGDQLADLLVAGGDGADAGDVRAAVHGLRVGLDGLDGGVNGLLHALAHDHGVGAGADVLQALADDGLCQQGGGGGAVACDVVRLRSDFTDELSTHILKRILELDFLGDRHAVVRDERGTIFLRQDNVAALRTEGDLDGICELVNAGLQLLTGVFAEFDHLCHDILSLLNYSTIARISDWRTMEYSTSSTLTSVPAYFATTTLSPGFTTILTSFPSTTPPGPTATTSETTGFSFVAVERIMPEAVVSMASTGLSRTRSARGTSFMMLTSNIMSDGLPSLITGLNLALNSYEC